MVFLTKFEFVNIGLNFVPKTAVDKLANQIRTLGHWALPEKILYRGGGGRQDFSLLLKKIDKFSEVFFQTKLYYNS